VLFVRRCDGSGSGWCVGCGSGWCVGSGSGWFGQGLVDDALNYSKHRLSQLLYVVNEGKGLSGSIVWLSWSIVWLCYVVGVVFVSFSLGHLRW